MGSTSTSSNGNNGFGGFGGSNTSAAVNDEWDDAPAPTAKRCGFSASIIY